MVVLTTASSAELKIQFQLTFRIRILFLISVLIVSVIFVKPVFSGSYLAVFLPQTGKSAHIAYQMQTALSLAYEHSDMTGRPYPELVYVDTKGSPSRSFALADSLSQDVKLLGFVGGYPSNCAERIKQVALAAETPYLILSSSKDSLTVGDNNLVYRIAPPSADYNDGLIRWSVSVAGDKRSIVALYPSNRSFDEALADLQSDLNKRWVGDVKYIPYGSNSPDGDLMQIINGIEDGKILWLLGSISDVSRIMESCKLANWSPNAFIFGSTSLTHMNYWESYRNLIDYTLAPALWLPSYQYSNSREFVQAFNKRTGINPDYHAAEAYAAGQLLVSAFEKTIPEDRIDFRIILENANLMTVFGLIKFDDYMGYYNQNRVESSAVQFQENEWKVIWPQKLSSANYIYPIPDWKSRIPDEDRRRTSNFMTIVLIVLVWIVLISTSKRRKRMIRELDD